MKADPVPFITVAIPTYNRSGMLRQTLDGLSRQDYPRDRFEVVVIDNNSTDDTAAVVREFPAVRHVVEKKQGLDHARNRAIAESRGEIIVFGDDDILMEPSWISELSRPLTPCRLPLAGAVGAVGGEVIPVFPNGLPEWVAEWHAPLAFRADAGPLAPAQSPMGANLAFPKWVFEKLGLFHTELDRAAGNYFSGGDSEMVRRVRQAGFEVWFAPAAAVKHQMPASRTTFKYAARHAFDSARSRVIDRAGQPGAAGYLWSRLPGNLLKALGFALLAALSAIAFQAGAAKKALVRAWRSCGYLYQIPRSLIGKM